MLANSYSKMHACSRRSGKTVVHVSVLCSLLVYIYIYICTYVCSLMVYSLTAAQQQYSYIAKSEGLQRKWDQEVSYHVNYIILNVIVSVI